MTKIRFALAAAGLAISAGSALAGTAAPLNLQPRAAYFDVFSYYCAPASIEPASFNDLAPQGEAALIVAKELRERYAGDCRGFYFNEIVRRIDAPTQQGLFPVDW